MLNSSKIILASSSPRRKKLLEEVGIEFDIVVPMIDETYPFQLQASKVPEYLAQMKAQEVYKKTNTEHIILAADTLVFLHDKIIGKPKDEEEAIDILERLSGKTHKVMTGVALLHQHKVIHFNDETTVEFYPLMPEEIAFYVKEFRPLDRAGAYSIDHWLGYYAVKSIHGDYNNVLGLPVSKTIRKLKEFVNMI